MGNKVYLFDFDGTLTTCDTLLAFIIYAKGACRFWLGLLLYSPLLVMMKLHLYSNGKAKQKVFAHFFKGIDIEKFDQLCHSFAQDHRERLLRPLGLAEMQHALEDGAHVFVVSASIDNWVCPFFETLPQGSPHVVGTQIETKEGVVTGRFLTPNCFGAEKVRRIKALLPQPRSTYYIAAFGDSRGDKEMLSYADEAHYKPFR